MLSKIKFENQWNELCPIFGRTNDYKTYEQIGTGVLLEIWDSVYLLTASHIIDSVYELDYELFIPTEDGFYPIDGELFHNSLVYGEKVKNPSEHRKDDNIDFSYYRLSSNFALKVSDFFEPLKEHQIDLSSNFSLDFSLKNKEKFSRASHVKNIIREFRDKDFTDEEIDLMDDFKMDVTITFAGYPLSKTRYIDGQFRSEIVYYHSMALKHENYVESNYNPDINILALFGKYGSMDTNFNFKNSPKPKGISGGGVYKIVRTENGFDRKLIGIGHQYVDKEHLFVGTNINHCLNLIKNNQIMPYAVHQRLYAMSEMLWEMDKDELLKNRVNEQYNNNR